MKMQPLGTTPSIKNDRYNGWIQWLDTVVGHDGWIRRLDTIVGYNGWIRPLDIMVEYDGWIQWLDIIVGYNGWVVSQLKSQKCATAVPYLWHASP